MAQVLEVTIASPARKLFSGQVTKFSCPTPGGLITILPHHAPLVSVLAPGEASYELLDGSVEFFHVDGGFIEVASGNKITMLADAAAHVTELDQAAAEEAKARAAEKLQQSNLSDEEYAQAAASLERSLSRINVIRKHAHRHRSPITGEGIIEQ